MTVMFIRSGALTLGTTKITFSKGQPGLPGLRVQFRVVRDLKPKPNKVKIVAYNLAPTTRKSIEQPKLVPVQLDVGYAGDNHNIFLGQLRAAESSVDSDGVTIMTVIESGDSEPAFSQARTVVSVPQKATALQLLQLTAKGLGVGLGNLAQAQPTFGAGGPAQTFHGAASEVFGRVVRASGMEWSVQDGALQVLDIGANVGSASTAVKLSSATGMIGSPTIDNKGIVKVKALIQPGLMPGRPVIIDGEFMQGAFRIEHAEFVGDTWGQEWTVDLHCRKWG